MTSCVRIMALYMKTMTSCVRNVYKIMSLLIVVLAPSKHYKSLAIIPKLLEALADNNCLSFSFLFFFLFYFSNKYLLLFNSCLILVFNQFLTTLKVQYIYIQTLY